MNKICSNCNLSNSPEAVFCRQCATPLPQASSNQPQLNYQQPVNQQNQQFNQQQNFGGNQMMQNASQPGGGTDRLTIGLILVVAGLFCCGPLSSIPGAVIGWLELTAVNEGRASIDRKGKAQLCLWGGIAVTIISSVIGFFIFILMLLSGGGGY